MFRRTLIAVAAATAIVCGALAGAGTAVAAPKYGDWIVAPDGTGCRYGYPYISGGGPLPGYRFDEQCKPVSYPA